MKYLLNKTSEEVTSTLTDHPLTNVQESPNPTHHPDLSDLNKDDPKDKVKMTEITNHPNYSKAEKVTLNPGLNKFKNEEWAEYFYSIIGGTGFQEKYIGGPEVDHWIIEADKEGNELKNEESSMWKKYRSRVPITIGSSDKPSHSQFTKQE
tara:strand:- start:496 stop:948 length:453 start_codon:yes stop_codon:yes gene_type:complete